MMEFLSRILGGMGWKRARDGGKNDGALVLEVPLKFRRGKLRQDELASVRSAQVILDYILQCTGFPSYESLEILDFGCGVKFSQALLQDSRPFGHYLGLDVYREMIEYLQNNVADPRLEYAVVPFQNDMYNREGQPMTADSRLPCGERKFDLITLQSVFTHQAPPDFQNLLHILRRYCKPAGRMFFTCFINNTMKDRFHDDIPGQPLMRATYQEDFIREMVVKAGWEVVYSAPQNTEKHVADHLVCKLAT
jgi:SAM-dependent methyltransferase